MARRKKGDPVHGWINLDKPLELGSTQAVGKIRRLYNAKKVGHAGTLDPLATGILPIALGEATKTIPYMQDSSKTYSFEVTWGEQRSTDDREGEVVHTSDKHPNAEEIEAALPAFIGEIDQIPPQFSAIKVDGERAYDLARDGEHVELKSRKVFIESLKVITPHPVSASLGAASPTLHIPPPSRGEDRKGVLGTTWFRLTCGKGTYVRSLARDIGQKLGCYGYVSALRREKVGPFTLENAISLDKLGKISDKAALFEELLPVQVALDDIPAFSVTKEEAGKLRNGQSLSFTSRPDFERLKTLECEEQDTVLTLLNGKAVGLVQKAGPVLKPAKIFNL